MRKDIFFVCNPSEGNCDLTKILELLKSNRLRFLRFVANKIKNQKYHILSDQHDDSFLKFAKKSKIRNLNPSKLVFFGYKEQSLLGIKALKSKWFIGYKWFDFKNTKCIGVFFVSNGAQILDVPEWPSRFNNWVSFKESFDPLSDIVIKKEEIIDLYDQIFNIIFSENDPKTIKEGIEKAYHSAFETISLKYQNVDGLMAGYKLNFNKAALTYSPETK